jgi:transcriptional regulator with XRE-family HTH domain
MLNIGERIIQLRKQYSLSQSGLAKKIGASRTIVGNYERNSNTPSIEMLIKIANVFNVTIDYLIGQGQLGNYDKDVVNRIEDIEKLDSDTRGKLFFLIDNVVQNYKTRQAFITKQKIV